MSRPPSAQQPRVRPLEGRRPFVFVLSIATIRSTSVPFPSYSSLPVATMPNQQSSGGEKHYSCTSHTHSVLPYVYNSPTNEPACLSLFLLSSSLLETKQISSWLAIDMKAWQKKCTSHNHMICDTDLDSWLIGHFFWGKQEGVEAPYWSFINIK